MRASSVAAALLLLVVTASASDSLSPREIAQLKRICASLFGTQYLSRPWQQLKPYLRDKDAFRSPIVCSASCGGSIPLRGRLFVDTLFVNPSKGNTPWGSRDALVYSISLSDGKRKLFHRETEPKT